MTDAPRSVAICVVLIVVCFASVVLADDFKTINGHEYKDATVTRVEPDGIVLSTKSGISKVYFVELPKEVQQRFHYDAAQAAQFTMETQTAISQRNTAIVAEQQAAEAEQRRKAEIQRQQQAEQQHQEAAAQQQAQQHQIEIPWALRAVQATQAVQSIEAAKFLDQQRDAEIRFLSNRVNDMQNQINARPYPLDQRSW
jgi:hypothetical protein